MTLRRKVFRNILREKYGNKNMANAWKQIRIAALVKVLGEKLGFKTWLNTRKACDSAHRHNVTY